MTSTTNYIVMRLPSAVETGKKGIEQTKVETATVEVVPVQKSLVIADRDRGIVKVDGPDHVRGLVKGRDDGIIVIGHRLQDGNGTEVGIGNPADVIETVIVIIVAIVTVIEIVVIVHPKGRFSIS